MFEEIQKLKRGVASNLFCKVKKGVAEVKKWRPEEEFAARRSILRQGGVPGIATTPMCPATHAR